MVIMGGDTNMVLRSDETSTGRVRRPGYVREFQGILATMGVAEFQSAGYTYSPENDDTGRVLDRIFVSVRLVKMCHEKFNHVFKTPRS